MKLPLFAGLALLGAALATAAHAQLVQITATSESLYGEFSGYPNASRPMAGTAKLDLYYEECVIGGAGAFIVSVQHPAHLAQAIRRKLVLEIAEVPPGATLATMHDTGPRIDCMIGEKTRPSWLDEDGR